MDDKVTYFIDQTNERLKSIEAKVDTLISFRIMLIGASVAVSSLVTFVLNIAWLLTHKV